MERKEKIKILKQVEQGDISALKAIETNTASGEDVLLCFYYMLENPIEVMYEQYKFNSVDDLDDIINGVITSIEDDGYHNLTNDQLDKIIALVEGYNVLKERQELHLLKPYKKFLLKN